jgi:hypothetical protein
MYSLEICQFIVTRVHTNTEEETRISPVNDFVVAELRATRIRKSISLSA